jgi:transcriptional regulator with XRE-family HTH domain
VADPALLGRQLRGLRAAAGRTVASVANDAGLSVPYIANLENGRGNPTVAALDRLAAALGARLDVSLVSGPAPAAAAPLPSSLVRLGRTARFQRVASELADALGTDGGEFPVQLVGALAGLAAALGIDPGESGWGRLLDALLLIALHPLPPAG